MHKFFFFTFMLFINLFTDIEAQTLSLEQREKIKIGMSIKAVERILEFAGKKLTFATLPKYQKMYR